MEALARFATKSRINAIIFVMMANLIPLTFFLGSACAALVVLRKGFKEGGVVFGFAAIPALFWVFQNTPAPLFCLLGTMLLACCLRTTMQWQATLLLLLPIACGIVTALLTVYQSFFSDMVQQLHIINPQFLSYMTNDKMAHLMSDSGSSFLEMLLLKGYVFFILFHIVVAIILARYWQSVLYNPGAFKKEVYEFRWPIKWVCFLLVGMVFVMLSPFLWVQASLPGFLLPLLLAGLAVGHYIISIRFEKHRRFFVFLMYLLLLFSYPFFLVLAGYDSWVNLRNKIR